MSNSTSIKLACFDVGGVIIRICRTWTEGCRAANIDVRHTETQFEQLRPEWTKLVFEHQTGRLSVRDYARQVSHIVENLYTPEEIEAVHDAWLCEEYEGVGDIIEQLNNAGIHTVSLSNTNHAHWSRMPEYPAMMRLKTLYASHELGLHKPDEAIYRKLEQLTGCTGHEILFFDDLPENIATAQSIGWNTKHIDPLQQTAPQMREALTQHNMHV